MPASFEDRIDNCSDVVCSVVRVHVHKDKHTLSLLVNKEDILML